MKAIAFFVIRQFAVFLIRPDCSLFVVLHWNDTKPIESVLLIPFNKKQHLFTLKFVKVLVALHPNLNETLSVYENQ